MSVRNMSPKEALNFYLRPHYAFPEELAEKLLDACVHEYQARIHVLEARLAKAEAALRGAIETIHEEFCGSHGHHGVCDDARAYFEEFGK